MYQSSTDPHPKRFLELDEKRQHLVSKALTASASAYAPYSEFAVGSAIQTLSGDIYQGANFENASLGLSICAEVSALAAFYLSGASSPIKAIAVVGHKFSKPREMESIVTPCGRCRQLILEVAQLTQKDIEILSSNGALSKILIFKASELLPYGFGPENFRDKIKWEELRNQLSNSVSDLIKHASKTLNKA